MDKRISLEDRLIMALDLPSVQEAKEWVRRMRAHVRFYKVGFELFLAGGFPLVEWITAQGFKVFLDLKFFDVPQTVHNAVAQLRDRGVTFTTVHGNDGMLEAAVAAKGPVKILAVTALTSLDKGDLEDLGFSCDVQSLVLSRARRALRLGCDGIVSSGLEVAELRENLGSGYVAVVPGIRPVANVDDQKRTVDVYSAFRSGADYIVVGRPIRQADDPDGVVEQIRDEIRRAFGKSGQEDLG